MYSYMINSDLHESSKVLEWKYTLEAYEAQGLVFYLVSANITQLW